MAKPFPEPPKNLCVRYRSVSRADSPQRFTPPYPALPQPGGLPTMRNMGTLHGASGGVPSRQETSSTQSSRPVTGCRCRQPVGCGLPCGWARLPARQAKALPAFARGAGEGVPAFLAGCVRQGVGVGHRRASGAKGTRKGQTRDKTGTQGTQTEGTDRTTPLKGLSLSSRVFAVVPSPR